MARRGGGPLVRAALSLCPCRPPPVAARPFVLGPRCRQAAFPGQAWTKRFEWWEILIDACFYIDIGLTFVTGLDDGSGSLEKRRRFIARHYLRGWFWVRAPRPAYT